MSRNKKQKFPIYPDLPSCTCQNAPDPKPEKKHKKKKRSCKCCSDVKVNIILKFDDCEHKIKC